MLVMMKKVVYFNYFFPVFGLVFFVVPGRTLPRSLFFLKNSYEPRFQSPIAHKDFR